MSSFVGIAERVEKIKFNITISILIRNAQQLVWD